MFVAVDKHARQRGMFVNVDRAKGDEGMGSTYTKTDLVRELAQAARISRRRVEAVLDTLTLVAYREAKESFAVPGICRLDVVHRKARQIRNPQTGDILMIAAHDALRVRPVKRARDAVAPAPRALVQVLAPGTQPADAATTTPPPGQSATPVPSPAPTAPQTESAPTPVTPSAEPVLPVSAPAAQPAAITAAAVTTAAATMAAAASPAAVTPAAATAPAAAAATPAVETPAAASAAAATPTETTEAVPALATAEAAAADATPPASEGEFLSFCCKDCGQEIEAPVDMAGNPSECPTCGASLIVPYLSEPGTIWDRAVQAAVEQQKTEPKAFEAMKGRTIRIELADEI